MLRYLLLITFLTSLTGYSQQPQPTFSEALEIHLPKYKEKADKAYRVRDVERAQFLFDSLVNYCLKGSKMDNFQVRNLKQQPVHLSEFEKPVYLITNASWVVSSEGEIPALNKLAEDYHEKIDFVMLFWDDKATTEQLAEKYHDKIKILYVDELQNNSSYVIKKMKHSLGLPTFFLLDRDKKVLDIRRKVSHPYGIDFEESFDINFEAFSEALSVLLIKESSTEGQYTVTP